MSLLEQLASHRGRSSRSMGSSWTVFEFGKDGRVIDAAELARRMELDDEELASRDSPARGRRPRRRAGYEKDIGLARLATARSSSCGAGDPGRNGTLARPSTS